MIILLIVIMMHDDRSADLLFAFKSIQLIQLLRFLSQELQEVSSPSWIWPVWIKYDQECFCRVTTLGFFW